MRLNKKGFTLFELLLMIIIISVGIIAIVAALNNGLSFMQKTREKTIAINLAREGIEAVYQIRDTNWKRRGGKKESCRLKVDPLNSNTNCADDTRMGSGYYFLTTNTFSGQEYFVLSGGFQTGIDLSDGIDSGDQNFGLCQSTGDNSRYACTQQFSREGQFFRQIKGLGLFQKDSTNTGGDLLNCNKGTDSGCSNDTAKEYRFCSEVQYIGRGKGSVELCGVLTNFQQK